MRRLAAAVVSMLPFVAIAADIPDLAEARAFASATLPTLEAHLKKIQSIASEAGVSADSAD